MLKGGDWAFHVFNAFGMEWDKIHECSELERMKVLLC